LVETVQKKDFLDRDNAFMYSVINQWYMFSKIDTFSPCTLAGFDPGTSAYSKPDLMTIAPRLTAQK
jgi:hypothetical protein